MPKFLKLNIQFFGEDKAEKEIKTFDLHEVKATEERGVIEGYASTFGNIDRHGDVIVKGAYKNGRSKVPIFALHRADKAIGVGHVQEDDKGLKIRMKLAVDNADSEVLRDRAREYYALAKEGIVEKMSVGFLPLESEWKKKKIDGKDIPIRYITKADLVEVSLVPIPANDKARVTTVKTFDDESVSKIAEKVCELLKEKQQETSDDADNNDNDQDKEDQETKDQDVEQTEEEQNQTKGYSALIANRLGLF